MPRQFPSAAAGEGDVTLQLPEFLRAPFSAAMSQSVLLPAFIALFGITAALFLVGFPSALGRKGGGRNSSAPADGDLVDDGYDDDDYVELILLREPDAGPPPRAEPLEERFAQPRRAPADDWHSDPVDSWDGLLGFAHNGSHVDDKKRFRPIASPSADDPTGYGRHSSG